MYWSQVTACERSRRKGIVVLGLPVRIAPLSPLTEGVSGEGVNEGSPAGFDAIGYVPKLWSKEMFS